MHDKDAAMAEALAGANALARHYAEHVRAERTIQLYARQWQAFAAWCAHVNACPLPAAPTTLAGWLAQLAHQGRSVSAINVALAAVIFRHRQAGHGLARTDPSIAAVLGGIARRCARPVHGAAPLDVATLKATLS